MEIKKVEEKRVEYPKINKIGDEKIKTLIPDKWVKLGVTSGVISVLTNNKSFATSLPDDMVIVGGLSYYTPIYGNLILVCGIIKWITMVNVIISTIIICYTKIKYKGDSNKKRISRKIKVLIIVSVIFFILANCISPIIENVKYYRTY